MTEIGCYRCMLVVIVAVWAAESLGEENDSECTPWGKVLNTITVCTILVDRL